MLQLGGLMIRSVQIVMIIDTEDNRIDLKQKQTVRSGRISV